MDRHSEEQIRDRAYALWVAAGSPEGEDVGFWHQAERELAEQAGLDSSETAAAPVNPPLPAGNTAL